MLSFSRNRTVGTCESIIAVISAVTFSAFSGILVSAYFSTTDTSEHRGRKGIGGVYKL